MSCQAAIDSQQFHPFVMNSRRILKFGKDNWGEKNLKREENN